METRVGEEQVEEETSHLSRSLSQLLLSNLSLHLSTALQFFQDFETRHASRVNLKIEL